MPVQINNSAPVSRPPGQVPMVEETGGLVEIRLHGVGGTTPQDLLGDLAPQQVAGDRIAGFYRTADQGERIVEAYSWGGLTSRSASRVLWLLLLPFALANLTGWMVARSVHRGRARFGFHRWAVRFASLAMTVNFVVVAAMMGMDLIGYQCGQRNACLGKLPEFRPPGADLLVGHPARWVVLGSGLPVLAILLLCLLALKSINRYESVQPPVPLPKRPWHLRRASHTGSAAAHGRGLAAPEFWDGQFSARRLGELHIAAAVAVVGAALAYTTHDAAAAVATPASPWLWKVALGIAGVVVAAVVVTLGFETTSRPWTWLLMLVSIAGGVVAAVSGWVQPAFIPTPTALPGMRLVTNIMYGAVAVALVAVLIAVALGRREPGTFVWGGPVWVLGFAFGVLNIVAVSVIIRVTAFVASVTVHKSDEQRSGLYVYDFIGRAAPYFIFGLLAVVVIAALVEVGTVLATGRRPADRAAVSDEYAADRPGDDAWHDVAADDEHWLRGILRARREARMKADVDKVLALLALAWLAVVVILEIRWWFAGQLPWTSAWMVTLSTTLGVGVPLLILFVMRSGWRDPTMRKHIGILWDVATFWPRAYHPFAPPCYAERAVPELQRRLWYLHEVNDSRVVLAAHSQGSIIAAAAMLQPDCRPPGVCFGMATFGSPLRTLYHWAFPAYFTEDALTTLVTPGSPVRMGQWRNFSYRTDYIGGPVFPAGTVGPAGAVDQAYSDPRTSLHVYGQEQPPPGRHSGYWSDPRMWTEILTFTGGAPTDPAPTDPASPDPAAGAPLPDVEPQPVPLDRHAPQPTQAGTGIPPAATGAPRHERA